MKIGSERHVIFYEDGITGYPGQVGANVVIMIGLIMGDKNILLKN